MAGIVAEMRRQVHDPAAYTALDAELHLAIAEASENRVLGHLIEAIREPLEGTIRAVFPRPITVAQRERVQELHEALVAALEAGQAAEAGRVMAVHFDEAVRAMAEVGTQSGDGATGE